MSEALGVAVLEVKADIRKLVADLDRAKDYADRTLRSAGQGMMAVGGTLTNSVTRPVIGLIENVAQMAISWESSFADVKKATQGTDADLSRLGEDILKMSTTMPVKPEAIASIVALGGQLGVARGDVLGFAETISRLGVSTNLTIEDAAMKFAKFTTITAGVAPAGQSASEQIARMGNVLVHLGNNSKTTERDIMSMSMRIAAAGNAVGMSQQEILGWGAALSSAGVSAETGGSSISKAMQLMAKAVAQGGDKLESFARIAGMTSDQFANLFKSDPSRAILAFAEGLNTVNKSGGDLYGTLSSVGMNSSQLIDVMTRLSGNTGEFSRILGIANEGYTNNNALVEESNKRFETSESKIAMAKNSLQVLGITIGEAVLPALVEILAALTPVIVQIAQFAQANPEIVALGIAFLGMAAVVGPILTAIGAVTTFVGSLSAAVSFLTPLVSAGAAVIGAAIGAISLPVVLVGAAIAALAVAWYNNWGGIQEVTLAAWNAIKATFEVNVTMIASIVTALWESIKALWTLGKSAIETLTSGMGAAIVSNWQATIALLTGDTTTFKNIMISQWESLKSILTGKSEGLKLAQIESFVSMFAQIGVRSGVFSSEQVERAQNLYESLKSKLSEYSTNATSLFSTLYETVKGLTDAFKMSVVNSVVALKNGFVDAIASLVGGAVSSITNMASEIMGVLNGLIGSAASAGAGMAQAFGDGIRSALGAALDAARAMAQALRDLLPGSDAKRGPLSDLTASGSALPATFAKGIDMTSPTLTRSVTGMISKSLTNNVTINNPVGRTARSSLVGALQNMEFAT